MTNLSTGRFKGRKPRGKYHHGELREAVLAAALQTVARQGTAAVTVREIARALGVTNTAVHYHFASRLDLLVALAADGYRHLEVALETAAAGASRPDAALLAVGVAYVRFATTDVGHFRVMFGGELAERREDPELATATADAYRVFTDAVSATLREPGNAAVATIATGAWALVHGLAVLLLDQQIPGQADDPAGVERLTRRVLRQVRFDEGVP